MKHPAILRGIVAGALALAAMLAFTAPAEAQLAPAAVFNAWWPVAKTTLAVTNSNARVALPSAAPVAVICNTGTKDAFLKFGTDNTVVATTSSFLLRAATCRPYAIKPFQTQYTYVAAIAGGSDSTSLDIETGLGSP